MSEFDKIIDDLNKLDIKLNKFYNDVIIVKENEKKKLLHYCNICSKFHGKKDINPDNKEFKKLFSYC